MPEGHEAAIMREKVGATLRRESMGDPKLVRTAPVSDPCFAGRGLSLERGAHFLAHVGRFMTLWQK